MALVLNTEKSSKALSLCLSKRGITPPIVDVAFAMDVSGSFHGTHQQGITSDLLTRLLPWALVFDPDKKAACYTFASGKSGVSQTVDITENNYDGYVKKYIINKVNGYGGGTDYSYVLNKILSDISSENTGIFAKMFGSKKEEKPLLLLFITDGANSDENETRTILKNASKNGRKLYVQFIGVNRFECEFNFIKELGEDFDNVGFTSVKDINEFIKMDDNDLNEMLISDELVNWLSK